MSSKHFPYETLHAEAWIPLIPLLCCGDNNCGKTSQKWKDCTSSWFWRCSFLKAFFFNEHTAVCSCRVPTPCLKWRTQWQIQDFGQEDPAEFDPRGPWAQNVLKIEGFPLKLPENCMILKKSWGQGGLWPPGRPEPLRIEFGLPTIRPFCWIVWLAKNCCSQCPTKLFNRTKPKSRSLSYFFPGIGSNPDRDHVNPIAFNGSRLHINVAGCRITHRTGWEINRVDLNNETFRDDQCDRFTDSIHTTSSQSLL